MKIKLLVSILGTIILAGGSILLLNMQKGFNKTSPVACSQEAKICPDGTGVGRTGPNCEFASCPTTASTTSTERIAAGYVAGHVSIGPFCPVERPGVLCPVPDGAYSSRQAVIYYDDGVRIRDQAVLDKKGNYRIALGPGNYFVQIQPAGIGAGEKKPFTVISFQTTTVDFNIDTGIR